MKNKKVEIHTVEFKYAPDYEAKKLIKERFIYDKSRSKKEKHSVYYHNPIYEGIRYEYHVFNKPDFKTEFLVVIANPKKVLGKETLLEKDCGAFLMKYKHQILQDFSFNTIKTEKFTRIDYYIDIILDPLEKKLLLKLYKKLVNEYSGMKKTNYKSSIYYNSRSKRVNIYSRFEKIIEVMKSFFKDPKKVNVNTEIIPYISDADKNTFRFEVQLKRKKIHYYLKKDGTIPELFNYWNMIDSIHFLNETLRPILFEGDYYYKYKSQIILKQHYSNRLVKTLIDFQCFISNHGLDAAKRKYKNYNKYISDLQKAGVNPILIPNNETIKFMPNPLRFLQGNIYKMDNVESLLNNTEGIANEVM